MTITGAGAKVTKKKPPFWRVWWWGPSKRRKKPGDVTLDEDIFAQVVTQWYILVRTGEYLRNVHQV